MRSLLALAVVLALAVPAQAHECTTWTTSTTNAEMLVVELPEHEWTGFRYFVNDLCQDDRSEPRDPNEPNDPYGGNGGRGGPCVFSYWLYADNNGIDGLQRGDEQHDDTCHGMIEPDHFLW